MTYKYSSTLGYLLRYTGGALVGLEALNNTVINSQPLGTGNRSPEDVIGGIIFAGVLYFIGDRIHNREIQEHKLSILEHIAKKI